MADPLDIPALVTELETIANARAWLAKAELLHRAASALTRLSRELAERDTYITHCEDSHPPTRHSGGHLPARSDTVVDGIAWLVKALTTALRERDEARAALARAQRGKTNAG